MANVIEKAKLYQSDLDKALMAQAVSGILEVPHGSPLIKYSGGDEVKIADIAMDGLADYDRQNGFNLGSVTLKYSSYKLTQDRGRSFSFDAMDVDESNFLLTAGTVLGEFQRTQVAPEVDCYRFSQISKFAEDNERAIYGYTPVESTILNKLLQDVAKVEDGIGSTGNLVIFMNTMTHAILNSSEKISKRLDVTDFKIGEITTQVRTLDGIPILKVPSARFKSRYEMLTGKEEGNKGGFKAAANAQDINWLIMDLSCALAVQKTDNMRIFDPQTNQKANAWLLDYRKFHDIWCFNGKKDGMIVNINGEKITAPVEEPEEGGENA